MKKLAVCGCSYMTSSYHLYQEIKGQSWPDYSEVEYLTDGDLKTELFDQYHYEHKLHFVDLYIQDKNFNYINLAYGGASNFLIRLQIEQAIQFKPDYVIISATSADRFEIPLQKFEFNKLIRNYDNNQSERHITGSDNNILASSSNKKNLIIWPTMEESHTLSLDKATAIKYYLNFLNDQSLNEIKHYYIIQSGLMMLETLNIPYIFLPGPLKHLDWSRFSCWPTDKPQPWDYNISNIRFPTGNHLPSSVHREMVKTLNSITIDWHN